MITFALFVTSFLVFSPVFYSGATASQEKVTIINPETFFQFEQPGTANRGTLIWHKGVLDYDEGVSIQDVTLLMKDFYSKHKRSKLRQWIQGLALGKMFVKFLGIAPIVTIQDDDGHVFSIDFTIYEAVQCSLRGPIHDRARRFVQALGCPPSIFRAGDFALEGGE